MRLCINPFSTNFSLLFSLKTTEKRRFSDVFRGYGSGTLVEIGLINVFVEVTRVTLSVADKRGSKLLMARQTY